jgi:hypothetical protein
VLLEDDEPVRRNTCLIQSGKCRASVAEPDATSTASRGTRAEATTRVGK